MRAIHQALRGTVGKRSLYLQGDAPKHTLLARFRAQENAVLVATMSFWEGVDVPGYALRLVVIDKIPFAVPSDPIVAARCAVLEAEGGNPFVEYSVPMAAITLKQGFGRLVRSTRDAGIVAILDRRVTTRSYGKLLLSSLPPTRRPPRSLTPSPRSIARCTVRAIPFLLSAPRASPRGRVVLRRARLWRRSDERNSGGFGT
ncbi:MAG: helicase C-terminal domain-containing protein [Polyangiaceae bacterium]